MMERLRVGVMVWCVLGIAPAVSAQEAEEAASEPSDPTASLGIVWTNHYFFRGIVQETDGLILQPSLESGFTLFESDGALSSVGLSLGVWSSLHTEKSDNMTSPRGWYEADFYAGMSFGLGGLVSLDLTYTAYTSPNGSFATVHELAGSVGFDDSSLWENLAGGRFGGIAPSITVARELDGTAFGPESGTYLEAGIGPSVTLVDAEDVSLSVSVPVTLGTSLGDYYEDDTGDDAFGYVNAGVSVATGLGFVPSQYGSWELSVGGSALMLGDRLKTANEGRGTELIAQAGLSVGY